MKPTFLVCLLVSLSLLSTSEAIGEEDSPAVEENRNLFDAMVQARAAPRRVEYESDACMPSFLLPSFLLPSCLLPSFLLKQRFPVGDAYMTLHNVSPANYFPLFTRSHLHLHFLMARIFYNYGFSFMKICSCRTNQWSQTIHIFIETYLDLGSCMTPGHSQV